MTRTTTGAYNPQTIEDVIWLLQRFDPTLYVCWNTTIQTLIPHDPEKLILDFTVADEKIPDRFKPK